MSILQDTTMETLQIFHMNKGVGEASYAKNCNVQNQILSITKPFVEAALHDYSSTDFPETMTIADLGCSSGPNAFKGVREIMDVVSARCRKLGHRSSPKFMVFLNDLAGNDFNEVFASLSNFQKKLRDKKGADFGPCFVAGLPGNFYGRLLPDKTLHFVHSSSSLHWLSQVPPGLDAKDNPRMLNKGKIYLSVTSPSYVINAYQQQFRTDFLSFLKSRSEEVISGGRMVLAFMGRLSSDPTASGEGCYPWEFIAQSLMTMVSEFSMKDLVGVLLDLSTQGIASKWFLKSARNRGQHFSSASAGFALFLGLIEEEKVDSLNVPYYAPCLEELKQLIEEEASFYGHHFGTIEIEWDGGYPIQEGLDSCRPILTRGERIAKMHRAVAETMLEHHFGAHVMDELFRRYGRILDYHLMSNQNSKFVNVVASLIRK